MVCTRGRATPNEQTRLRLFAASGGVCQNPACLLPLFREEQEDRFHVAEMAHIVAVSPQGPRADTGLTAEQKGGFDNLILLCPTCHTTIDKAPDAYPDEVVRRWKAQHAERLAATFGAVEYETRTGARRAIEPLLAENKAVFDEYGPLQDYRLDPESDAAGVWKRKMLAVILPNNRRILRILDVNRSLLNQEEIALLESFRIHVDDLEERHLGSGLERVARRFPEGMNQILADD